jgi:predicted HTH transcriptional regulator
MSTITKKIMFATIANDFRNSMETKLFIPDDLVTESTGETIPIDDVIKFLDHEMELVSRKRSNGSSKPTAKQAEQDAMREKILAFLRENGTSTATDIQNALSISNQRVNGLMRPLVKSGEIIRTEDKKKAYFSVAVPDSESED